MNPENRNMILAISLSMAVLFGWQVFVVGPELEQAFHNGLNYLW